MKKILLSLLFITAVLTSSFAQDKKVQIGLRLSPNLSFTGASNKGSGQGYSNGSTQARLMFGPTFDFFFSENYAFSTGIWYNVKAVNLKFNNDGQTDEAKFNAQYLTIPVTLKLYTNEVADDLRIYFQLGGVVDFKIGEKAKNDNAKAYQLFNDNNKVVQPVNIGPYLGVGAEYVLSSSNTLFAGINYNRGVISVNKNDTDNLKLISSQLALEIGLKF